MQITLDSVSLIMFYLVFAYVWMPPTWLLMRFLTPKVLVERYFKQPHFTSAELVLFAHFPGSLMRTGIFMNLCMCPHRGKRRQMTDVIDYVPRWYVWASKLFLIFSLVHGAAFILLLAGIALHLWWIGKL